jgi:hypothetical protein
VRDKSRKFGEVGEMQGISYLHGFPRARAQAGQARRTPCFAAHAGGTPRYPLYS